MASSRAGARPVPLYVAEKDCRVAHALTLRTAIFHPVLSTKGSTGVHLRMDDRILVAAPLAAYLVQHAHAGATQT